MRLSFIALAASALALGGCSTVENFMAGIARTPGTEQTDGYLQAASASDLYEIEAGRLAVARGQRPDVRDLGQRLINEHGDVTRRLAFAASLSGTSVPVPALTATQQQMLGTLQAASADSFDRTFLSQQHPSHEAAMRIHHAYALAGPARELREVAEQAVTASHQHLDRVRQIEHFIARGG